MAAIAALLSNVPNSTFYRSRESAFSRDEGTAILLQPEEERVEKRAHVPDLVLRRLTVVVTVITRGDVPDKIADDYLQQVQSRLLSDPTLGGLCAQLIEQGTKWTFQEADLTSGMAEIRFDLIYQTLASNLMTTQ